MDDRLPFKKGDEVWVKATVEDCYRGSRPDVRWVTVELPGNDELLTVDASVVRPAELDVDEAFGGMPEGTVEVSRERYFEIPEVRRAVIRTQFRDFGGKADGEAIRYFEVTGRG